MKKRIGWLVDNPSYIGGAELSMMKIRENVPDDVEIVECPPGVIDNTVDGFVVWNCTQYGSGIIDKIKSKPVIKIVQDIWKHGDGQLKEWLLNHAKIVMVTPELTSYMKPKNEPIFIPCPIDWERFEEANKGAKDREGTLYMGAFFPHKGIGEACQWAQDSGLEHLDFYGFGQNNLIQAPGRFCGNVIHGNVPAVMAQYEQLIFLPQDFDPCPRVVLEAYYAGLAIITNGWQGSSYWIDNNPDAIENSVDTFWNTILEG